MSLLTTETYLKMPLKLTCFLTGLRSADISLNIKLYYFNFLANKHGDSNNWLQGVGKKSWTEAFTFNIALTSNWPTLKFFVKWNSHVRESQQYAIVLPSSQTDEVRANSFFYRHNSVPPLSNAARVNQLQHVIHHSSIGSTGKKGQSIYKNFV